MDAPRSVLIIDDDREMRAVLRQVVQLLKCQVIEAKDGQHAIAQLASGPRPDLILLDLTMPHMDGRAFRQWQLQNDAYRTIPVVVLSGLGAQPASVMDLGCAAYLPKPVDLQLLLRTLRAHLPKDAPAASR